MTRKKLLDLAKQYFALAMELSDWTLFEASQKCLQLAGAKPAKIKNQEKKFKKKAKEGVIGRGRLYMTSARESGLDIFLNGIDKLQSTLISWGGGHEVKIFGTTEGEIDKLAHQAKINELKRRLKAARKTRWILDVVQDAIDAGISVKSLGTSQKEADELTQKWFRHRAKHSLAQIRAGKRKRQDLYWLFSDIKAAHIKPSSIGMTKKEVTAWEPLRYK